MLNSHGHEESACRIERAQPCLGTLVSISVEAHDAPSTYRIVDTGFAAIAQVHRLMSFHEPESDVSRLNRSASILPVTVHPHTAEVIRLALDISAASDGVFDITIAGKLIESGLLSVPVNAPPPDANATWRDIEFVAPDCIRFRRPTWIDLGGIAKGYAVDQAIERMQLPQQAQRCVNAGGDLRIAGPGRKQVLLRVPGHPSEHVPMVEIASGSIASSSRGATSQQIEAFKGPHIHGVTRKHVAIDEFASVLAERCVIADALTKVALAGGHDAAPILKRFGATAFLHSPRKGWHCFGYDA